MWAHSDRVGPLLPPAFHALKLSSIGLFSFRRRMLHTRTYPAHVVHSRVGARDGRVLGHAAPRSGSVRGTLGSSQLEAIPTGLSEN